MTEFRRQDQAILGDLLRFSNRETYQATNNFSSPLHENPDSINTNIRSILDGKISIPQGVDRRGVLMRLALCMPWDKVKLEVPFTNQRDQLELEIKTSAEMAARLRDNVEELGNGVWNMTEIEVWDYLHRVAFGSDNLFEIQTRFPNRQIRDFDIRFLRFLEGLDVLKDFKGQVGSNPGSLFERGFSEVFPNRSPTLVKPVKVTPLAFIATLPDSDFLLLAGGTNIDGVTCVFVPGEPRLSGRLIVINDSALNPSFTEKHEFEHALHRAFFQSKSLIGLLFTDEQGHFYPQIQVHRFNSRQLYAFYREYLKNELIAYNLPAAHVDVESSMILPHDVGEKFAIEYNRIITAVDADEFLTQEQKDDIKLIYQRDYERFEGTSLEMASTIDYFYKVAESHGVDRNYLTMLLQITEPEKLLRLLKILRLVPSLELGKLLVKSHMLGSIADDTAKFQEREAERKKRLIEEFKKKRTEGREKS